MSVREVHADDHPGLASLHENLGWNPPSPGFLQGWATNPAVKIDLPPLSPGWILEQEGQIVGYLGNLPQLYSWQNRTVRATAAVDFGVLPAYRGQSMQLVLPFVRQKHTELLFNTTASIEASRIFQFLRFKRLPQSDFDVSYYWITRPAGFLNAAFHKKHWPPVLSRVGAMTLAPALWLANRIRHRRPRPPRDQRIRIDVIGAEAIGPEFDELWQRKRSECQLMLAVRSAEVLRWRFSSSGKPHPPRLIRAWDGGRLAGYAAVVRLDNPGIMLKRCRVADLLVEADNEAVIQQLLCSAYELAVDQRADMLEVMGFPEHIRNLIGANNPYRRSYTSWSFLFNTSDKALDGALSTPPCWYATPFDGDGF